MAARRNGGGPKRDEAKQPVTPKVAPTRAPSPAAPLQTRPEEASAPLVVEDAPPPVAPAPPSIALATAPAPEVGAVAAAESNDAEASPDGNWPTPSARPAIAPPRPGFSWALVKRPLALRGHDETGTLRAAWRAGERGIFRDRDIDSVPDDHVERL